MDLFLANTALVCGVVFLIAAGIMKKWPPKEINSLYGYRTSASMRSQPRWDFAQAYSATQMMWWAIVMIVSGLALTLLPVDIGFIAICGLFVMLICTIGMIFNTEMAIKKRFKD